MLVRTKISEQSMVAENGQNLTNQNQEAEENLNKDENGGVGETSYCWTSSPKWKIKMTNSRRKPRATLFLSQNGLDKSRGTTKG